MPDKMKKTQIDKFREAAGELEADESMEAFERTLEKHDSKSSDKKKPAD